MGYQIHWNENENLLSIQLLGKVTSEDLWEVHQINTYHVAELTAPAHIFVDADWVTDFPMNMLQNVRHTEYMQSPMIEDVIVSGDDNAVNFMFILLSQMYQFKLAFANASAEMALDSVS